MVQWLLRDMLDLDVMTATGKTLGENLEDLQKDNWFDRNLGYLHNYGLTRDEVIFPVEKAPEKGSVAILKGNIAPEGSVLKYSACAMNQREVVNAKAPGFQPRGGRPRRRGQQPDQPRRSHHHPLRGPPWLRYAGDADDHRGHRAATSASTAPWR